MRNATPIPNKKVKNKTIDIVGKKSISKKSYYYFTMIGNKQTLI